MNTTPDVLVLYDGDCGFCNRSVAYILKREKSSVIHFAPIQSEFTQRLFAERGWEAPDLNTFYLIEKERKYEKSSAAMKVLKYLKAPYSWLRGFWIVPRAIRDWGYDFIAARRQRIAKGYCVIPTPDQAKRFLS